MVLLAKLVGSKHWVAKRCSNRQARGKSNKLLVRPYTKPSYRWSCLWPQLQTQQTADPSCDMKGVWCSDERYCPSEWSMNRTEMNGQLSFFEVTHFKCNQISESAPALVMCNDCLNEASLLGRESSPRSRHLICSFSIIVHQDDTCVHENNIKIGCLLLGTWSMHRCIILTVNSTHKHAYQGS